MEILVALRPKNMEVRERALSSIGEDVTTYVFNGREYTHVGSWPPSMKTSAEFHVPIASAYTVDTGHDITRRVRRFAGPKHRVTQETIRYALGSWSWRCQWTWSSSGIRCTTIPYLTIPSEVSPVCITDVLGHVSVFCAR
jgi:hypothetical protein